MQYGAVLTWWVFAIALGLAGMPIAATVLRRLPDRGAALSFPVSVVVLTLPIYWIGHLSYGTLTVWIGLIVLVVVSVVLAWRGPVLHLRRFGEAVVVFSAGFFFLVATRATNPSIRPRGGEKFLDYGLLKSVLRAGELPIEDFWFAGEPLQYYYLGHLISGSVTELTGIAAPYAYTLAVAWFYGLLLVAVYGVAGSIAASRGHGYRTAGAVGVLFVGVASNTVTPVQTAIAVLPAGLARAVADFIVPRTDDYVDAEFLLALRGDAGGIYWSSTRIIDGTINEFPFFAFVNGDLHAHMMSQPFMLLVVGLALAYYLTPGEARWQRRTLVFGAIPPVAGLIGGINTWSFPTTAGVTWLAVLFAPSDPRHLLPRFLADRFSSDTPSLSELSRVVSASLVALGVLALGVLWTLPFFLGPATGGADRSIGFVVDRSGLVEFFLVHGWILLVFGAYFLASAGEELETDRPRMLLLAAIALALAVLADAAAFALVLPLAVVAWWGLRRADSDLGFESVLFVAGAGMVLLVEVVFLAEGDGGNRHNTVFKSYAQIWVLWGTAAAVPVGRALSRRSVVSNERVDRVFAVAAVVLLISVSIYAGIIAADQHSDEGERTLDATTWAGSAHATEWDAIQWMDDEIQGQPNIASAPGCGCHRDVTQYSWANAPSTFTGIPTVVGWGFGSHQSKYRGNDAYIARVDDVEAIYTGDRARSNELLAEYDVEYVYVGPNERALYGDVDFTDRPAFEPALENRLVTIYRVDQSEL